MNNNWQIIEVLSNDNKVVKNESNLYGMINKEGQTICNFDYKSIHSFNEGIGILESNNYLHGYIDINGNIICECKYLIAEKFENGLALVRTRGDKIYRNLINRFGIEILPPLYSEVRQTNNYIVVKSKFTNSSEVLLDYNLNIIFDTDKGFYNIREVNKNLFIVRKNKSDELVNRQGTILTKDSYYVAPIRKLEIDESFISCEYYTEYDYYREISSTYKKRNRTFYHFYFNNFGDQFCRVHDIIESRRKVISIDKNGSWHYGYLDDTGKIVIPCIFDKALNFNNGRALVAKDKESFFIDLNGSLIKRTNPYKKAEEFIDSMAIVENNDNLYGIINLVGEEVVACKYNQIVRIEKIFCACIGRYNKKCAIINNNGVKVSPLIYDTVGGYNNQRAAVCVDDKWGFIDPEGCVAIRPIYNQVTRDFSSCTDTAEVILKTKLLEIDKFGKIVKTLKDFSEPAEPFYDGYTQDDLDEMYRGAFDGFPDAQWNID